MFLRPFFRFDHIRLPKECAISTKPRSHSSEAQNKTAALMISGLTITITKINALSIFFTLAPENKPDRSTDATEGVTVCEVSQAADLTLIFVR